MIIFCPNCGNRLLLTEGETSYVFKCLTCPHIQRVKDRITAAKYPKLKDVDDVLNDANTWKNVDQADTKCPKCEFEKAYFMQLQTRSADEPSTTFYRCVNCTYNWKEN